MEVVRLHSIKNVRDISYGNIKPHRLLRGGSLNKISNRDKKILRDQYDLKLVIDLRTDPECLEKPDRFISGVKHLHLPLMPMEELGVKNEKEGRKQILKTKTLPDIKDYYCKLVNRNRKEAWTKIFNVLLEQKEGAVLIHCTVGKDRSGIVSLILLKALGIDTETAIKDYLHTNESPIVPRVYRVFARMLRDKDFRKAFLEYFVAKEEYIYAALEYIDMLYGSIDQFLVEICGLTPEKRKKLQELYLIK